MHLSTNLAGEKQQKNNENYAADDTQHDKVYRCIRTQYKNTPETIKEHILYFPPKTGKNTEGTFSTENFP